jgi:hypothetical protein
MRTSEPDLARIGASSMPPAGDPIGRRRGPSLLAGYGYEHVGVFHAGKPRNNLGDWAAYRVPPPRRSGGAQRRTARWPGVPTSA